MAICALRWGARPWGGVLRSVLTVKDEILKVTVGEGEDRLVFPNPVGLAAGFDKDAVALPALENFGFGFLEAGTLTPTGQPGNPPPRLFRFVKEEALVNRMGFNNAGADKVSERLARSPGKRIVSVPLGFNIGKMKETPLDRAAGDYVRCLEVLYDHADYFVVNVSSPNTPELRRLQEGASLAALLTAVREKADEWAGKRPARTRPRLLVKISPDENMEESVVESVLAARFDGIVATNTTRSRDGLTPPYPEEGGMSGRPLRHLSTDSLRRIHRFSKGRLLLIGSGGVFSAEDAYEKILAGASLVQIYTGWVYSGFTLVNRINRGLSDLLRRDGFSSVMQAVGRGV